MVSFCILIQVRGFEVARKQFGCVGDYNGLLDTVRKILQQEGLFGFYKGMFPGILKVNCLVLLVIRS